MANRKTINIVCHYASIYGGNFIPSLQKLAANLSDFNVMLTFPIEAKERNWMKYLIEKGYKVCLIDFSNKKFKKDLKNVNKNNDVDILYTHFLSGLRIKLIYPFSKKIKLFVHVHSDFTAGKKTGFVTKLKEFVEFKVLRKDTQYIYVSEAMWKRNSKYKGQHYVQNALCLERIPAKGSLNKHDFSNSTVFLTFGWSPYVKGLDITVKSFLLNKSPNNKLLIIHGKDNGYKRCIGYLEEKLGIDDFLKDQRIIFLPPAENVFDYYSVSDIFISASRSEGFSYSVLEALYFDLKVFCSDIEGTLWAKKYQNAYFFKSESVDALSLLMNKNSDYKKPSVVNETIISDFNINLWCEKIKKILLN